MKTKRRKLIGNYSDVARRRNMEMATGVFTGWIIRFGGLIETFYVNDGLFTCHQSEAKIFMHKDQAADMAKELQKDYSCGVSIKKA